MPRKLLIFLAVTLSGCSGQPISPRIIPNLGVEQAPNITTPSNPKPSSAKPSSADRSTVGDFRGYGSFGIRIAWPKLVPAQRRTQTIPLSAATITVCIEDASGSPVNFYERYYGSGGSVTDKQVSGTLSFSRTGTGSQPTNYSFTNSFSASSFYIEPGTYTVVSSARGAKNEDLADGTKQIAIQANQTNQFSLTLTPNEQPSITGVSPAAAGPGDLITINGSNFAGLVANAPLWVNFGGATASPTLSGGTLTVAVPGGAATGGISVVNDGVPSALYAGFSLRSYTVSSLAGDAASFHGQLLSLSVLANKLIGPGGRGKNSSNSGILALDLTSGGISNWAGDVYAGPGWVQQGVDGPRHAADSSLIASASLQPATLAVDAPRNRAFFVDFGIPYLHVTRLREVTDIDDESVGGSKIETIALSLPSNLKLSSGQNEAIATDAAGNVYVVVQDANATRNICRIAVSSGDPPVPGDAPVGTPSLITNYNSDQGPGTIAGMAIDSQGNLWFSDYDNNLVHKISLNPGGTEATSMAQPSGAYSAADTDVSFTGALFHHPGAIAADKQGNVYVSESFNPAIMKISPQGMVTSIVPGALAAYWEINGLAIGGDGSIYAAASSLQSDGSYLSSIKVISD